MFTNNYYKYNAVMFCSIENRSYDVTVVDTIGNQRKPYFYNYSTNPQALHFFFKLDIATASNTSGLHLGDGTAEPTKDDYKLSGNTISGLTEVSRARNVSVDGNKLTTTDTITVQNTNSESVTVSEVAWVQLIHCDNKVTGNFMLDRTLLDTPVTIPAGGEGIIVYKRSVNF